MNELQINDIQETLIEIHNNNGELKVSARDLFIALKLNDTTTKFTDWIKKQLDNVDGIEDVDFNIYWYKDDGRFKTNVEFNGNVNSMTRNGCQQDYILTLDIAKEICMVVGVAPRTNKETKTLSKQIRKYFIECEKKLKEIQLDDEQLKGLALLKVAEGKTIEERISGVTEYTKIITRELRKENENLIEEVEGYEGLIDSFINKDSLYSIRDVGKSLKGLKFNIKDGFSTFGANNVFHYLRDRGVLYYKNGQNKPNAKYEGKYIKMKLSEAINGWGQPVYVCYFTKDGIKWFFKKIVREGIIDKEHAKEVVKNMIPDEKDDDIYPF